MAEGVLKVLVQDDTAPAPVPAGKPINAGSAFGVGPAGAQPVYATVSPGSAGTGPLPVQSVTATPPAGKVSAPITITANVVNITAATVNLQAPNQPIGAKELDWRTSPPPVRGEKHEGGDSEGGEDEDGPVGGKGISLRTMLRAAAGSAAVIAATKAISVALDRLALNFEQASRNIRAESSAMIAERGGNVITADFYRKRRETEQEIEDRSQTAKWFTWLPLVGQVVQAGEHAVAAQKMQPITAEQSFIEQRGAIGAQAAHLASFSGPIAAAEANLQVGDILRDINQAQALGPNYERWLTLQNKTREAESRLNILRGGGLDIERNKLDMHYKDVLAKLKEEAAKKEQEAKERAEKEAAAAKTQEERDKIFKHMAKELTQIRKLAELENEPDPKELLDQVLGGMTLPDLSSTVAAEQNWRNQVALPAGPVFSILAGR